MYYNVRVYGIIKLLRKHLKTLNAFSLDPWTGARVPGVHGPPGFWAQTWPNHYEEEGGYTGSPQKTNEGMWFHFKYTFIVRFY